jgi:hypothetical protein
MEDINLDTGGYRKMIVRFFMLFLFINILGPIPSFGGPSISDVAGSITKGADITIRGNSFGTRNIERALRWDDFESGNVGTKIGAPNQLSYDQQKWKLRSAGASGREPIYDTNRLRPGSSKSSFHNMAVPNENCYGSKIGYEFNSATSIYLTWWAYYKETANKTNNWKFFRHYGSSSTHVLVRLSELVFSMSDLESQYLSKTIPMNEWIRLEFIYKAGTNGYAKYYLHKPGSISLDGDISGNITGGFNYLSIMDYYRRVVSSGVTTGLKAWLDDLYIDTTQARVEIGNAIKWSECTHREIQIPKAWRNDQITISANPGSFSKGSTAYLFVVDANGGMNANGFEISIGGTVTNGSPPPAPTPTPTNLRVVSSN